MGPFDWLNNIKQGLEQWFAPTMDQAHNTMEQYFPSKTMNYRLDKSPKAPDIQPVIDATARQQTQQPQAVLAAHTSAPTAQDFQQGFSKFGSNVPVATASGSFAQAAQRLPPTIDPYLPAVISLMESGGGAKAVGVNNPFNISGFQNGNQQFINYPSFNTALLGGDNNGVQSQGFVGTLLNNPSYGAFRKSGNMADFFNTYTPPGPEYGNPTLAELLQRYQALRALFPGVQ